MRILPALALMILLGGCSSERQFAYDSIWPFGDPNAPIAASETAQRALGHQTDIAPLTPQAGNVWPGPVTPVPTLSQEQQNMTEPLGQAYTPSLPSPYPPGTEPPVNADLGFGPLTSSPSSDGLMAPNVSVPPSAGGLGTGMQPPLEPPMGPAMPGAMGSPAAPSSGGAAGSGQ